MLIIYTYLLFWVLSHFSSLLNSFIHSIFHSPYPLTKITTFFLSPPPQLLLFIFHFLLSITVFLYILKHFSFYYEHTFLLLEL